jgi:plasmid stability protein
MIDNNPVTQERWALREVDVSTIRKIKVRAAADGVSIAEALKRIVTEWEAGSGTTAE